jgi:hypothetical protein
MMNPHVTGEHVSQTRVCMYVCVVTKMTRVCDDKLTFTAQRLPYLTPRLTFTDSAFCPHSVFMCFLRISEQTAIISLYSLHWLVFITQKESVYCAVRSTF